MINYSSTNNSSTNNVFSGEFLTKLHYIEDICANQAKLYGYSEVCLANISLESFIKSINNIDNEEIKKYFCIDLANNIFYTIILNREDNFADIESIQLAKSILQQLNIKYSLSYNYSGCVTDQSAHKQRQNSFKQAIDNGQNYSKLLKQSEKIQSIMLCNQCERDKQSLFNGIDIYFPEAQYVSSLAPDILRDKLIYEFADKNKILISGGRFNKVNAKSFTTANGFIINLFELANHIYIDEPLKLDVLILIEQLNYRTRAFELANKLRSNGFKTDLIMQEKLSKLIHARKYLLSQSTRLIISFETKLMKRDAVLIKDLYGSIKINSAIESVIPNIKGILSRKDM